MLSFITDLFTDEPEPSPRRHAANARGSKRTHSAPSSPQPQRRLAAAGQATRADLFRKAAASDAAVDEDVLETLHQALASNAHRVIELFHSMDRDESGVIDRKEFGATLASMQVRASRREADALFRLYDADGSGELSYRELNRLLRTRLRKGGAPFVDDPALRPGARGIGPGAYETAADSGFFVPRASGRPGAESFPFSSTNYDRTL